MLAILLAVTWMLAALAMASAYGCIRAIEKGREGIALAMVAAAAVFSLACYFTSLDLAAEYHQAIDRAD